MTPVKNQGDCSSCWAFSAIGALEGAHSKSTGNLVALSEQNLVDCDTYDKGCFGGSVWAAFEFMTFQGGVDTQEYYPYRGLKGYCEFTKENIGATMSSYWDIEMGNEVALKAAVSGIGTISVAMDATDMQFYSGGIYTSKYCSNSINDLNHALLVVGYGRGKNQYGTEMDYWLIKNSWGESWGIQGYLKLVRNSNNMCGVATFAFYPII